MPKRRARSRISYPFPVLSTERPDLIQYKEALENILQYTRNDRILLSPENARKLRELEEVTVQNLEQLIKMQYSHVNKN